MTDLSPAAQAVLAALDDQFYELNSQHMAAAVAALRAAANEWLIDEFIDGVEYIRTTTLETIAAELEAEGPTDEELANLMSTRFLVNQSASARAIANIGTDEQIAQIRAILDKEAIAYARAVLARWGRPAAAPVPVSERLPGPEDCDEQGRCWRYIDPEESMGNPMWELARSKYAGATYGSVAWLPAHALPLPAPEGKELTDEP